MISKPEQAAEAATMHGLVLAGGKARRMGGCNKALQHYQGRPLIAHVLERISRQSDAQLVSIAISAAHSEALRATLLAHGYAHCQIVPDIAIDTDAAPTPDAGMGPLHGIYSAMAGLSKTWAEAAPYPRPDPCPWLLCVPCDTPHLPLNLAAALWQQAQASGAAFVAEHPLCCVLHMRHNAALGLYLAQGGRKVRAWLSTLAAASIESHYFASQAEGKAETEADGAPQPNCNPSLTQTQVQAQTQADWAFTNINTTAQLEAEAKSDTPN